MRRKLLAVPEVQKHKFCSGNCLLVYYILCLQKRVEASKATRMSTRSGHLDWF